MCSIALVISCIVSTSISLWISLTSLKTNIGESYDELFQQQQIFISDITALSKQNNESMTTIPTTTTGNSESIQQTTISKVWDVWRSTIDEFPCHDPRKKLPFQKLPTSATTANETNSIDDVFPLKDKAFYTKGAFDSEKVIPTKGLLFIKPMKVGSSTATGINLRISKNIAKRQQQNFPICENSYDHSFGSFFKIRDVYNSFLWSFVRHPTKRAVSWYFHFLVSRKKMKPSKTNFIKSMKRLKDYYIKLHSLHNFDKLKNQWVSFKTTTARPDETDVNDDGGIHEQEDIFYERVIQQILGDYNFIGVTERFDESLVVLQTLLGVPLGDLLYLSSKSNGGYDDLCTFIQPSNVTDEMKAYLKSDDWLRRTKWDLAFYQAANASLDLTIESLPGGRNRFETNLKTFRSARDVVEERCQPQVKLPCTEDGKKRKPSSETNCLFLDSACAYSCIDEVARDLGLDGRKISMESLPSLANVA